MGKKCTCTSLFLSKYRRTHMQHRLGKPCQTRIIIHRGLTFSGTKLYCTKMLKTKYKLLLGLMYFLKCSSWWESTRVICICLVGPGVHTWGLRLGVWKGWESHSGKVFKILNTRNCLNWKGRKRGTSPDSHKEVLNGAAHLDFAALW